jgi:hypothetical protein
VPAFGRSVALQVVTRGGPQLHGILSAAKPLPPLPEPKPEAKPEPVPRPLALSIARNDDDGSISAAQAGGRAFRVLRDENGNLTGFEEQRPQ